VQRTDATALTEAIAAFDMTATPEIRPAPNSALWRGVVSHFVPPNCLEEPDLARRAQLLVGFGTLGGLFGLVYAIFYFLIGHFWGAGMIVFCTTGVALTPFLMRWTGSIRLAGHLFSLILVLGFTGLCFVEGGLHGHAIAWLVSVPLCTMLLLDRQAAAGWALGSFSAAGLVMGIDLSGHKLPVTYDARWDSVVSGAGYLGLIAFMFILGRIFEDGRAHAFAKMQVTLRELAASNERLVHLNQEKNEFLGIAAHDLKNPLSAVIMCADLLQMGLPPEKAAKMAGDIAAAGTRMRDLIKNLLDANAIEQGKFTSNLERCDLGELAGKCVEDNRVSASRKHIEIRLAGSPGVFARADRNATMQILDNLLSNAIKYSPPGGAIEVWAKAGTASASLSVKDSGPGISEADQRKLFQKFTRLSARPTAGESSNGLGLSIVKRLAEAMSGSVHCQSVLGSGATFSLQLPVWPEAASSPTRKAA
jgi:signal transduction histidine kinase